MRIGAHITISKGLDKACHMVEEIGGNAFQFFTRNPRGGSAREIGSGEIKKFKEIQKEKDIGPLLGHLPYTVNMAAEKDEVYAFAASIVGKDLQRGEAMGADYLVCHPGRNHDRLAGLKKITVILEEKLAAFEGQCMFLLETMAGDGSEIGSLTELQALFAALGNPKNLGVCLDSCHLFAAGWDFRDIKAIDKLKSEEDKVFGLERVKAFHVNDALFPVGSGKDRHARIGQGYIGEEGFRNIVNDPFFATLPLILETPVDKYTEYKEEIKRLLDLQNS